MGGKLLVEREGSEDLSPARSADPARKSVVVCDVDEVLVNIGPLWCTRMSERWDVLGRVFDEANRFPTAERVLGRKDYDLVRFMSSGRLGTEDLGPEELDAFFGAYRDGDFYADCELTPMGRGVRSLALQEHVGRIYLLTAVTPGTEASKGRFLRENFGHEKFEVLPVPLGTPKSAPLLELGVGFDLLVDDSPRYVAEILLSAKPLGIEVNMPALGYNDPDEHPELARALVCTLSELHRYDAGLGLGAARA